MNSNLRHPDNFGPYLDREFSDTVYEEIRLHLEHCQQCREEVEVWQALDARFRSPSNEIEVPSSQWESILTRIESSRRRSAWRERIAAFMLPYRIPGWRLGAAVVLLSVLCVSALKIEQYWAKQQILSEIGRSRPEWNGIGSTENPFQSLVERATEENPFEKLLSSAKGSVQN